MMMSGPSGLRYPTGGEEEAIVPLPSPRTSISRATAYRSTWVVSSLESLRCAGHIDRYLAGVDKQHRDRILSCVAGEWLPMAVVSAHYRACDALGLSNLEMNSMSRGPGSHVRSAWFSNYIAAADKAKDSPWTIVSQLDRTWYRGANGGACGIFRLGPKHARIEYVGCELFDIAYFRQSVRAVLLILVERFGTAPAVRILPQRETDECTYQLQWA
jgi:hypothetical protein